VLSGFISYTGGTTLSDGLLQLNSSSALGSSSGSLTVDGGILNLNGQSINVGNLTGAGGKIWNNGPSNAVTLTIGNGNTGGGNYAGQIIDNNGAGTGTVALTKTGNGTITLSGTNTYTGATNINGGVLLINGSTAAGSVVTVNNSGTLGGTGTVSGTVDVKSGGTLSPGTSPGTLHTGALTLENGSMFAVDLTASAGNDLVVAPSVTLGTIVIGPSLNLNITGALSIGQQFFIVDNTGGSAVSGVFAEGAAVTSGSYTFLIDYVANYDTLSAVGGNDIMLEVTAVPEPNTWVAAGMAFLAVGYSQRRRFVRLFALA
jgi:autotransporter-associated beta strand protein